MKYLKLILLVVLSLIVPPVGLILFFVYIKKNKAISIGSLIGCTVGLIFYWPYIQLIPFQQKCNVFGKEYRIKKCKVSGFKCVSSNDVKYFTNEFPDESMFRLWCNDDISTQYDSAKPIIYLYPENKMELTVKVGFPNNITHSYPKYKGAWNVIAYPDGTLIDKDSNRELYSLYWEGKNRVKFSTDDGFVVKGEDTIKFLEEKLSILGLNARESEEFIVYWLPKLENNKYNYIRFATLDEIDANMPLYISSKPDSIIRVLMLYKSLDKYKNVKEQQLITPQRSGFSVVEWGGKELE